MNKLKIQLSALDQASIVGRGKTSTEALIETTELAKLADRLGFTRYWVSEHHNALSIACTSPEIFVAHLASHTENIRVGAGGIMLPNHSALKVAENFRMLEALYPNRIDLGIGRAPGTDRLTAALLNPSNTFSEQDFVQQLYDLGKFLSDADDKGTIFERVKAYPYITTSPQRWLLSSSGGSALIAAQFGLPLSYAHFITPNIGKEVIGMYKSNFTPSYELEKPFANLAVFSFCSENEELVRQQQALIEYRFISMERGIVDKVPLSYEDIKDEKYSWMEQQRIQINRKRIVYGTPPEVKKRLDELINESGVDELMLVTYADKLKDRLMSLELIADMYDIV